MPLRPVSLSRGGSSARCADGARSPLLDLAPVGHQTLSIATAAAVARTRSVTAGVAGVSAPERRPARGAPSSASLGARAATMRVWLRRVLTVWRSSMARGQAVHSAYPKPQARTQPKSSVTPRSKCEREARSWLRATRQAQLMRTRVATRWLPPTRGSTSCACAELRRWRSGMPRPNTSCGGPRAPSQSSAY